MQYKYKFGLCPSDSVKNTDPPLNGVMRRNFLLTQITN